MHTHIHPCMHGYMDACIHACMQYMLACNTCLHANTHACTQACIDTYMHTCIHVSAKACIHACIHEDRHTYIHHIRSHHITYTNLNVHFQPPRKSRSFSILPFKMVGKALIALTPQARRSSIGRTWWRESWWTQMSPRCWDAAGNGHTENFGYGNPLCFRTSGLQIPDLFSGSQCRNRD